MLDRLADMSKEFRPWKTSQALIEAHHSGVLAWIERREVLDIAVLNLPDSTMGRLVHRAYAEQTSLGGGIFIFEDSGLFPGVKHRNIAFLTALCNGEKQTMVLVGQVEHRRGCSICLTWLGGWEILMSMEWT
jgi:hypothetical protein